LYISNGPAVALADESSTNLNLERGKRFCAWLGAEFQAASEFDSYFTNGFLPGQ
jgi:hypothetical protein